MLATYIGPELKFRNKEEIIQNVQTLQAMITKRMLITTTHALLITSINPYETLHSTFTPVQKF